MTASITFFLRDVLFVSGHTHSVDRHMLERGHEEIIAGASCGSWWRGEKGKDGIPYSLMNCGSPRGWFLADFSPTGRKWYNLTYVCSDGDSPEQASAFIEDGTLVVNVFGGSRDGNVTVLSSSQRLVLHHDYRIAPEVRRLMDINSITPKEYRKRHRDEFIPLRRLASPHVWSCHLPEGYGIPSFVRVRYRDPSMRFTVDVPVQQL